MNVVLNSVGLLFTSGLGRNACGGMILSPFGVTPGSHNVHVRHAYSRFILNGFGTSACCGLILKGYGGFGCVIGTVTPQEQFPYIGVGGGSTPQPFRTQSSPRTYRAKLRDKEKTHNVTISGIIGTEHFKKLYVIRAHSDKTKVGVAGVINAAPQVRIEVSNIKTNVKRDITVVFKDKP